MLNLFDYIRGAIQDISEVIDQGHLGLVAIAEALLLLSLKILWHALLFCVGWELSASPTWHPVGQALMWGVLAFWVIILLMASLSSRRKQTARIPQGGGFFFDIA